MMLCFARFVSLIHTIVMVVRIVLTQSSCDDVGKCYCDDYSAAKVVYCKNNGLKVIPEGLQLADKYMFQSNSFNTTNEAFRLSWDIFLNTVNGSNVLLYFARNPLMSIPEWFLDERLANVLELDLSDCQISSLAKNAFSHLNKLSTLNLARNPLGVLPDGLFRNQILLNYLELSDCQMRTLTENVFSQLNTLHVLSLSRNPLGVLPVGLFKNLTSLSLLSLESCEIRQLHEDIFAPLLNLTAMRLANNTIDVLPANIFRNQNSLSHLFLDSCRIKQLHEDIFAPLFHLEHLILSSNNIKFLPANIFRNQNSLTNLHLEINELEYLPHDFLTQNTKMSVLNLSENKIKMVSFDMLYVFSNFTIFGCFKCIDCNCKIVEDFNKWADRNASNATETLNMQKMNSIKCTDGNPITMLNTANKSCSDFRFPTMKTSKTTFTLPGIITTAILVAIGTLASLTAIAIVVKRITETGQLEQNSAEHHVESNIENNPRKCIEDYMMDDDMFKSRNIPPVDHQLSNAIP